MARFTAHLASGLGLLAACALPTEEYSASDRPADVEAWFTDVAAASGLTFEHFNGMSGEFFFPEHIGPGAGLLDYDADGDLDVLLVQGRMLGAGKTLEDATVPPGDHQLPLRTRLYRNDLGDPAGLRFTDVTEASGIDARGYGMGVAAGDMSNDGCVDVYLTHVGPNQLFRNECDGTFTDVSAAAGVDDGGWGVSAAFLDYDRDGWLDLYVTNYVHYDEATDVPCHGVAGARDYCSPTVYRGQPDRLYHNEGDGTFTDVTAEALGELIAVRGLGVATADYDGDGWIDIFVANDGDENQLWINQRDGTFRNRAPLGGVAFNADGWAEAGMGVDAGDVDNDGDDDLFLTHLRTETNTLYVNDGTGLFEDHTARAGLGAPSLTYTGWGTAWIDVDNDGWLDLLTVNGTIQALEALAGDPFPYSQRKQLFRNRGDGTFEDVTRRGGPAFEVSDVGRGAAFGDLDNDGAVDVVVANDNGPTQVLLNQVGKQHHWVGLRLRGDAATPRDMLGARVAVTRSDGQRLWRRVRTDGSFASASDPRVVVGLGSSSDAPRVEVVWPDGQVETWPEVPVNRWTTLVAGSAP